MFSQLSPFHPLFHPYSSSHQLLHSVAPHRPQPGNHWPFSCLATPCPPAWSRLPLYCIGSPLVSSLGMKVGGSLSLLVGLELTPKLWSLDMRSPTQTQFVYCLFPWKIHALPADQGIVLEAGSSLVAAQIWFSMRLSKLSGFLCRHLGILTAGWSSPFLSVLIVLEQ